MHDGGVKRASTVRRVWEREEATPAGAVTRDRESYSSWYLADPRPSSRAWPAERTDQRPRRLDPPTRGLSSNSIPPVSSNCASGLFKRRGTGGQSITGWVRPSKAVTSSLSRRPTPGPPHDLVVILERVIRRREHVGVTPSTTAKPEAGDRCPTRLLEDSPALEDRFGGAHRRLAEALSELAATEPGGRTVALEGGWGSGKSTVVQLLKSIFTSSSHAVVVFDAWAHQGDPLRRAFLETVIAELRTESRAWLDETRWGEKLEALAKRRRVETQRTRPRIEWLGRVLLALLLLVPLGGVLLNRGLQEDDGHLIALGVVLALGPLVAVLCAAAIALIRGRSFDFDSLLALVIRHIDSEVNRESIETPDPTSIEFEANFHDIVSEALAAPDRRLVIVLDNLDRVDPQSARDIVATLQVFVGSEEHALPGFERLWLLIPYDRIGLASVWSATAVDRGAEGDTFLDKLFAARFSTPPMAISAWHEYLRELLGEALPRHVTADFDMIIQLFARRQAIATSHGQGPADANAGRLVEAPTPRELKLFVNQIGVLHRQWDDDFELETLAYFVLLHRYGLDLASGLRSGTLPQEALVPVLPADARRQLAALHYGDSPERAEQLLYEEPLEAALAAGDGQAVGNSGSAHGFFAVLESRSGRNGRSRTHRDWHRPC